MTNLPRRPIEPLQPPPGSFERMIKVAQARRRRRQGVIVTSSVAVLTLVAGASFALGSSLGVTNGVFTTTGNQRQQATATTTPTAKVPATHKPKKHHKVQPPSAAGGNGGAAPATRQVAAKLHGRVVDETGAPVAGLYVQPGVRGSSTYRPAGFVATTTDDDGRFSIACPHAPVLLATWAMNQPHDTTSVGGTWGATFVGGTQSRSAVPRCGADVVTTVVKPGATVTGTVRVSGDCPGATFPLWLLLNGNRDTSVRLSELHDGDTYTFSGLPAGDHRLGDPKKSPLVLTPSAVSQLDDEVSCADARPIGSPSPTPTGTASGGSHPSPTATGTASPSPDGSPAKSTAGPTP